MIILKPEVHAVPVGWAWDVVVVELAGEDLEVESAHVEGSLFGQNFIPVLSGPKCEVFHLLLMLYFAKAKVDEGVAALQGEGFHFGEVGAELGGLDGLHDLCCG